MPSPPVGSLQNVIRSASVLEFATAHNSQFAIASRGSIPPNLPSGSPDWITLSSRMKRSSSLSANVRFLKRVTGYFMPQLYQIPEHAAVRSRSVEVFYPLQDHRIIPGPDDELALQPVAAREMTADFV